MKRPLSLSLLGKLACLCFLLLPPATHASLEEDEQRQKINRRTRSRPRPSRRQRRQGFSGMGSDSRHDRPHLDDAQIDISAYFQQLKKNRSKPRDILEGVVMAIQTLLGGVLASCTTLLGFPIASISLLVASTASNNETTAESVGVPTSMILGLIGGALLGSASAFTISLYSLSRALNSLFIGLLETPETLKFWILERRKWNPYEREWKERNQTLEDERQEFLLLIEEREAELARKRRGIEIADTKLYDLLEISIDATKSAIKKAYFSKAKDVHPDKNRDDPKAHELFVELHEAYSILSDDTKRSEYDRWGLLKQGNNSINGEFNANDIMPNKFDANLFVAIFFSGERGTSLPIVENYIGDLGLAAFLDRTYKLLSTFGNGILFFQQLQDDDEAMQRVLRLMEEFFEREINQDEIRRTARAIEIATHLVSKTRVLSDHILRDGSSDLSAPEESFRQAIRDEASQILKYSGFYGPNYLEIIGSSLVWETSRNVVPRVARASYRKWFFRKKFAHAIYNLFARVRFLAELNDPTADDVATACLPDILQLINVYNEMDISNALKEAIWKVLNDPGVSRSERRNRKLAIRIIGEEFTKLAADSKAKTNLYGILTVKELKSNFLLAYKIASKQR